VDLDDRRSSRRSALLGVGSLVLTLVVMIMILLRIDLGDEPAPDTLAPTTVPPITEPVPDTSPAIDYTPTVPPITPAKATTTTIAPSTIPVDQRIFVASPNGITTVTGYSSASYATGAWAVVIDLRDGGVVAQRVWPGYGQSGDTAIHRIVDGVETVLVAPADPANQWIRLHDVVADGGGSDKILYSVKNGLGFDSAFEELFLFDLATNASQSLGVIGGWEDGPGRLSIGGDVIVGETFSQIESAPFVRRRDGTTIDPNIFGLATSYSDCAICPKAFAIDERGAHLVWVEDDLLVVVDVATAERVAEVKLVAGLGRDVDSLDVSGSTVLVNAYDRNTGVLGRPYVYGFDGTSVQLPEVGSATFAR
jgi:hypothetical protein